MLLYIGAAFLVGFFVGRWASWGEAYWKGHKASSEELRGEVNAAIRRIR